MGQRAARQQGNGPHQQRQPAHQCAEAERGLEPGQRQAQKVGREVQHLAELRALPDRPGNEGKDQGPQQGRDDVYDPVEARREYALKDIDNDVPADTVAECHAAEHDQDHAHGNQVLRAIKRSGDVPADNVHDNHRNDEQQTNRADNGGQADQPVRELLQPVQHHSPRIAASAASPPTSAT